MRLDAATLLGRPERRTNPAAWSDGVAGRRVLVTGAGGSIGAELARQIAGAGPARLSLLNHSEAALYAIDAELGVTHPEVPRAALLADIRDAEHLVQLLDRERPEVVFHAAAIKHVPLAETNPEAAVLTNVFGTRNLIRAARAAGSAALVMISTDKAVAPLSVMGASKRVAERVCQAQEGLGGILRPRVVRFGNVLGSSGSVVPLFARQIAAGGPVTVTHRDVRRYFMTAVEAVDLVLQAARLEAGPGAVFALDMGAPLRIQDLARRMIDQSGHEDIEIRFTGLRPGEKLDEAVFHPWEDPRPSGVAGIHVGRLGLLDRPALGRQLTRLEAAARAGRTRATLRLLADLLPEAALDALGPAAELSADLGRGAA